MTHVVDEASMVTVARSSTRENQARSSSQSQADGWVRVHVSAACTIQQPVRTYGHTYIACYWRSTYIYGLYIEAVFISWETTLLNFAEQHMAALIIGGYSNK